MSTSWAIRRANTTLGKSKKRKINAEPEVANILNMLSNPINNEETPSFKPTLGEDPGTKLYTRDNHIYFQDDINFDSASALIKEINDLATELKFMQVQYKFPEPAPIILHITSPGGIIHAANNIIDCMEQCSVPVNTIVDGFAASCGTLISIHGVHRSMGRRAHMLIHQMSSTMWGTYTEAEQIDHNTNVEQTSEELRAMYRQRTNMTNKQLRELLKHDMEWNADECLRRGLVDEIC